MANKTLKVDRLRTNNESFTPISRPQSILVVKGRPVNANVITIKNTNKSLLVNICWWEKIKSTKLSMIEQHLDDSH